jgi:hypothetical protein
MNVKHPGYYSSWLHVVTNIPSSTNINLYDWIGEWTQSNYKHKWTNTSKKLNAILTIPINSDVISTSYSIPAITIDNRFRAFDRITLKIAGKIIGGYRCYQFFNTSEFEVPGDIYEKNILTIQKAFSISAFIVGGGGGGGSGNEKGNGGSGGGGGGGGCIEGDFNPSPGTNVGFKVGSGGKGARISGPFQTDNGDNGGNSAISFTDKTLNSKTWTAGGGKGGTAGGGTSTREGAPGFAGIGGAGGESDTDGYSVTIKNGSKGGNGQIGQNDRSNGVGGNGGTSGGGGAGGSGGTEDGGNGSPHGGGGGGAGFRDREGAARFNNGGNGAPGFARTGYSLNYLAGPGLRIQNNFVGFLEIINQGGVIAGAPAIEGTPSNFTPSRITEVNISSLPSSPCPG